MSGPSKIPKPSNKCAMLIGALLVPIISLLLALFALCACGIPAVPPITVIAAPLAGLSLATMIAWSVCHRCVMVWRIVALLLVLPGAILALYLSATQHHLLDLLQQ